MSHADVSEYLLNGRPVRLYDYADGLRVLEDIDPPVRHISVTRQSIDGETRNPVRASNADMETVRRDFQMQHAKEDNEGQESGDIARHLWLRLSLPGA